MSDGPTTPAGAADSGSVWLADIGFAIDRVKRGRRVWREGWPVLAYVHLAMVDGTERLVYVGRNQPATGWFPEAADLLATDWRASSFDDHPASYEPWPGAKEGHTD